MRFRRIRSRRPPTKRQSLRPPITRTLENANPQKIRLQPRQSFERPTASSPSHPNASRYTLGLYKFTTGMIGVPGAWLPAIGLKIYSREAVRKTEISRALFSTLKSSSPPAGLAAFMNTVLDIVFNVSSVSRKISDVVLQVLGRAANRHDNKLLLKHSRRNWNMICQLYRQPDADALPTKTWVEFCIPEFFIEGLCKVQNKSIIVRQLQVKFGFHLKPQFHEADEAAPMLRNVPSRPIQAIVDRVLEAERRSIVDQVFADAEELVSTVKDAVLDYVRTSALARLVEFHHVEVAACGRINRRVVVNTLLNPDGSLKEFPIRYGQDTRSLASSLTQDPSSQHRLHDAPDARFPAIKGKSTTRDGEFNIYPKGVYVLSQNAQRNSGMKTIENVHIYSGPCRSQNSDGLSPVKLMRDFDRSCGVIQLTGAACIAGVATQLAACLPKRSASLNLRDPNGRTSMIAHINAPGRGGFSGIEVLLSSPSKFQVSIDGSSYGNVQLEGFRVALFGQHRYDLPRLTREKSNFQIATRDELDILKHMTTDVVEGICSEVEFGSYQGLSQLLAEGLLRTLQFPSQTIILQGVKVGIHLPEDSPFGRCAIKAEKWKGNDTTSAQDGHDPDISSTVNLKGLVGDAESQSLPEQPEKDAGQDKEANIRLQSGLSSAHGDSTLHHEQTEDSFANATISESQPSRLGLPFAFRGGVRLRGPSSPVSSVIQQKFCINKIRFLVNWKTQNAGSLADETHQKIKALLEGALEATSGTSLLDIQQAAETVSEKLPYSPELHLDVFMRLSRAPIEFYHCIDHDSQCGAHLHTYGRLATSELERPITLSLPGITGIPFNVEEEVRASQLQLYLYTTLKGVVSTSNDSSQNLDLASTVGSTLQILHDVLKPTLSTVTFKTWPDLTDKAVSLLFEKRNRFSDLIDAREINIRVTLKEHSQSEADVTPRGGIFIALGSNMGNRLENIEKACHELDAQQDIKILRTSALYETAPMYVEDQDRFLNGVCEIETSLEPMELLDRLQAVEQHLGRVKTIDKGPRNIDLDILLYQNENVATERLTIPHPLMLEREFVLRPLCDIWKVRGRRPDRRSKRYQMLLKGLAKPKQPMHALIDLAPRGPRIRIDDPHARTSIMSIMNLTPDSFSDGGRYEHADSEKLASYVKAQIAAGATIIDIGGQSSRPNAADITAEEEISRILPAIEAVKSLSEADNVAISVDTYRAAVAEAAINAGAHIINDISSGLLDPDMLSTIARLQCTYIMMHMRGTPATMMSEENCTYSEGLIPTIASELAARIEAAQVAGIRRWRIVLDPGIGFSKTAHQCLEILKEFRKLKDNSSLRNLAWLIGSSRKSFIGKITGVEEPKERGWGTAATVTAAIQGGADIVRVHDAEEMAAVVKMADAIYRV